MHRAEHDEHVTSRSAHLTNASRRKQIEVCGAPLCLRFVRLDCKPRLHRSSTTSSAPQCRAVQLLQTNRLLNYLNRPRIHLNRNRGKAQHFCIKRTKTTRQWKACVEKNGECFRQRDSRAQLSLRPIIGNDDLPHSLHVIHFAFQQLEMKKRSRSTKCWSRGAGWKSNWKPAAGAARFRAGLLSQSVSSLSTFRTSRASEIELHFETLKEREKRLFREGKEASRVSELEKHSLRMKYCVRTCNLSVSSHDGYRQGTSYRSQIM